MYRSFFIIHNFGLHKMLLPRKLVVSLSLSLCRLVRDGNRGNKIYSIGRSYINICDFHRGSFLILCESASNFIKRKILNFWIKSYNHIVLQFIDLPGPGPGPITIIIIGILLETWLMKLLNCGPTNDKENEMKYRDIASTGSAFSELNAQPFHVRIQRT